MNTNTFQLLKEVAAKAAAQKFGQLTLDPATLQVIPYRSNTKYRMVGSDGKTYSFWLSHIEEIFDELEDGKLAVKPSANILSDGTIVKPSDSLPSDDDWITVS